MLYLTQEEIPIYCTAQAGVDLNDIAIASMLIDSYVGYSFTVNEKTETVHIKLNHRGKLSCFPVIEIVELNEIIPTPLGYTKQSMEPEKIILDGENDGYFFFDSMPCAFRFMPTALYDRHRIAEIKYTYGYETIPEEIKLVCGMLAQNIRQFNSYAGFKRLKTLDYTIEMGNPSFFTDDMRRILDKYRLLR